MGFPSPTNPANAGRPAGPGAPRPPIGTPPPAPPLGEFELFTLLEPEAKKHGLPMDLLLRQVQQESRGNPRAISPKGAKGLMQLMDDTGASYGVTDPFDPQQNVRAGVQHMASLWKKHKGDRRAVLAEYNGGAAAVEALRRGTPWKETAGYLQAIEGPGAVPPPATPTAGGDFASFVAEQTPEAFGVQPPTLPTLGGPPPAPPNPADFEMGPVQRLGLEAAASVDPTSPEGRRNLAGAGGAALTAAGIAATGTGIGAIPGALAIAGGAGLAGAGAEAVEQTVGTKPPSGTNIAKAGAEQAGYELLGGAVMWPVKAIGRRMIASRVGRYASEGLSKAREATLAHVNQALQTAQDTLKATKKTAEGLVAGAKERVTREAEAVKAHVSGAVERARGAATQLVGDATASAERQANERTAAALEPYTRLVGSPPPGPSVAGRAALEVIEGPAKTARQQMGDAVDTAAETGPEVDISALKAAAQKIIQEQLQPGQQAFPPASMREGAGPGAGVSLADISIAAQDRLAPEARAYLAAAAEQQVQARMSHPVMATLQRILAAEDRVPFKAAHGFKRELDDALLGTWDKSEKKRVASMTQHLRGVLRQQLTGHAPYDQATAAYAAVAPLYTRGMVPALRKAALDSPEKLVAMIKPSEPTKLRMLRELLTTQAEAGGGGEEGLKAWNSVRAAWTHDKIIKGGIEKLGERLEKLSPEFSDILYGDETGRQVKQNLETIYLAYRQAVDSGRINVEQAKAAASSLGDAAVSEARQQGAAALKSTRRLGRQAMRTAQGQADEMVAGPADTVKQARQAVKAAKAPTAEELKFEASTLADVRKPVQIAADVLHTGALGPSSIYGALSAARLVIGPRSSDLIEWAAYSPRGTQLLVQAFTSPYPGMAVAELLRVNQVLQGKVGPQEAAAIPVPMPSHRVGTPPPTP